MKQQGIDNVQEAAKRLHISGSTLKSIMSSRGKRRYGDDCLRRGLFEFCVSSVSPRL
jgi:hypothetical protein